MAEMTLTPPAENAPRSPSLVGNTLWSTLVTIWGTAVSLMLTPFLVGRLGEQTYGLYLLLLSISGLLGVLDLGLGEATLRYVAFYYGRHDLAGINRVLGATLSVYSITGLAGWALLASGAPWIVQLLSIPVAEQAQACSLLRLVAISLGLSFPLGALGAIPQAAQRYDLSSQLTILQSVLQTVGSVLIVLGSGSLYGLLLWNIVLALEQLALNSWIAHWLIPGVRLWPLPTRAGLREVFSYGFFSLATQLLGLIWEQADKLLLGSFISTASVAYLTVPKSLAFRLSYALNATSGPLLPRFSALQEHAELQRLYRLATWCTSCAAVMLFVPLTVLMPDFLRLWINPAFAAQSAWIGQVLAFSCLLRGIYIPFQPLFRGLGKPHYITLIYLGSGLTSLLLNVMLISRFGLAGTGYTYILTTAWGFAALLFAWRQVLQERAWQPLVRAAGLPLLSGLGWLGLGLVARSQAPAPGWIGLSLWAGLLAGSTALWLIALEWLLGRRESYSAAVWQAGRTYVLTRLHRSEARL